MTKTTQSAASSDQQHPLVGCGLHYKTEDGCVKNQASIIAVVPSGNHAVGDLALIQYYEWFSGGPSTRRLIPLVELASGYGLAAGEERWTFFDNIEGAGYYYEHFARRHDERIWAEREKTAATTMNDDILDLDEIKSTAHRVTNWQPKTGKED
jgi:hypothetical protein